jgi:glycosyltransferase involved in cell wall biosynthesis
MREKLISICIPLYNGSKTISKTLDSMINDIKNLVLEDQNEIEIVLVDDCSKDDSFFIAEKYSKHYEFIRVCKNELNLGMDRNFREVALIAEGEYIWYCGQDDLFLSGAIKHVLDGLRNDDNIGVVLVNFSQYLERKDKIICESFFDILKNKDFTFKDDLLFNNSSEYFSAFRDIPSFLPSTLMKRDFWLETQNEKYFGTCFVQYATILLNFNKGKILVIHKPYIKGLIPENGWQTNGNKLFSIQLGQLKAQALVFNDSEDFLPKNIFLAKKSFYFRHFLRVTAASKYYRFTFSKQNELDLKYIFGNARYKLYFVPILFFVRITPYFLIKLLFVLKNG